VLCDNLIDPKIASHMGRMVKTTGNGLLVEFALVVDVLSANLAVTLSHLERM